MDPVFLLMRLLHVVLGVFWVGTIVFAATFLMPSMRDAGPEGGKVMLALMRRGYMTVVPILALLTLISGFWLYMHIIGTAGPAWAGSMAARVYGLGGIIAVIAFGLGMFVLRPNAKKVGAAMEAMATTPEGPARTALMDSVALPRAKTAAVAPWIAGLLTIATICMALARYM